MPRKLEDILAQRRARWSALHNLLMSQEALAETESLCIALTYGLSCPEFKQGAEHLGSVVSCILERLDYVQDQLKAADLKLRQ